ncbi:spiroplasma phage ORF1-like family protein [Spiroplasma endosymbiont of Dilophus febrilis]|uniref:spiroplasma phage ORF1-like family protein n=1 Tax=Spiroplasma endosymbiont of Dilophus febrilis TaxID=3066292 RepID=UPI00313ADDC2
MIYKIISLVTIIQVALFSFLTPLGKIIIPKTDIPTSYVQRANTGINEEDFINTMFLKAEFFENWSDTNYFINPTLKTSKPLKYNEKWYLDYIDDSYSTALGIELASLDFQNFYLHYKSEIDKVFNPVYEKLKGDALNWFKDKLYQPLSQNKKFFLKNVMELMLHILGAGQRYIAVVEEFAGEIEGWLGWTDDWFEKQSIQINNKLKNNFKYYTYHSMYAETRYWNKNGVIRSQNELTSRYTEFATELSEMEFRSKESARLYNYNGYLVNKWNEFRNSAIKFLQKYEDIIVTEMFRVQKGGSPNYEEIIPYEENKKIIFYMEIIDEELKTERQYIFTITINNKNKIQAGNLKLHHLKNNTFENKKLNFELNFVSIKEETYSLDTKTFSYENSREIIYEQLYGTIKINDFLTAFFSNAVIPIFQNRSSFIENGYLNELEYNSVLLNFFGLKEIDFINTVKIDEKEENKGNWNGIIKNIINISKNFYKDYLRALFDLNNNTYIQGQKANHGLLANNGFKIYPRYFYFSDKYSELDFNLYSAYKNKFYNTKYGINFNYDYSIKKSFNILKNEGEVFKKPPENNKYKFKHTKMEEQKIGYNIFELQVKK